MTPTVTYSEWFTNIINEKMPNTAALLNVLAMIQSVKGTPNMAVVLDWDQVFALADEARKEIAAQEGK